jgi:hypothetical protein
MDFFKKNSFLSGEFLTKLCGIYNNNLLIFLNTNLRYPMGIVGGKKGKKNRQGISKMKIFWFLIKMSISIF